VTPPLRKPFWRTLAWRLSLAFVLVSAAALGTVGFISGASTRSEFSALLGAQARENLTAEVQTYAQERGTLEGFRPAQRSRRGPEPLSPADAQRGPSGPGAQSGNGPVFRTPWVVLDPEYRAVFATPDLRRGARVAGERLTQATPIEVGGQVVGYLAPSGLRPRPDPRSEQFLSRTARAIAWAMLGAVGLAALLGVLMSRALLRPLGELLAGIQALRRGEEPAPPARVRRGRARTDEFGEVLLAFGEMHQDVLRNQQARRRLTADIAHDLNTPLSVISGTLEGILDGTFQPTPERLRRLHRETGHVAQLVNDLRFLSLADAGELQLSPQPTDVRDLIGETILSLRELAAQGGVTLDTVLPPGPLTVPLDSRRVTQVLRNLLSNALAHTPVGGEVRVEAALVGEHLRIVVSDTGSGISPEHLPHVFDRLYRADGSRSSGGSGLGLSICKSIVEAHGGQISLMSEPGRGTAVTFTLPAFREATSRPGTAVFPARGGPARPRGG